jgi:hypothetical protein
MRSYSAQAVLLSTKGISSNDSLLDDSGISSNVFEEITVARAGEGHNVEGASVSGTAFEPAGDRKLEMVRSGLLAPFPSWNECSLAKLLDPVEHWDRNVAFQCRTK